MCGGLSDTALQALQEKLAQLSDAFVIEDEQESESILHGVQSSNLALFADLDDDACQLGEVKELFSTVTLPLKVDKLEKVRNVLSVHY